MARSLAQRKKRISPENPLDANLSDENLSGYKDTKPHQQEDISALIDIIHIVTRQGSLEELLDMALDRILSVNWLNILPKGGVFVADEENQTLHLVANKNLNQELQTRCGQIKFGQCLCGRAAQSKQTQFAKCIDARHEIMFPDMEPHGHYNIPIMHGQSVRGVLVVYLPHGHVQCPDEIMFLENVTKSLGLLIRLKNEQNELQLSEKALHATLQTTARLRATLDQHAIVSISNAKGIITQVNKKFCEVSGYSSDELIGRDHSILKSQNHSADFFKKLWKTILSGETWQGEICNINKQGQPYWVYTTIAPFMDEGEGKPKSFISIRTEITQNKEQEKTLRELAHYDPLTKLTNRTLFADRFPRAIARCKRENTLVMVCFLDLDDFKQINDTHGHEVGDRILIQIADRIRHNIREEDTGCRQGGDEFVLLLGGFSNRKDCQGTLKRLLNALGKPYDIGGEIFNITFSCGATFFPGDKSDLDTLMRHADQAMYRVKLSGRNGYHIFDAEEAQEKTRKYDQIQEIGKALSNEEFQLHYQPKVNMRTGEVFGVEALIRWQHPQRGMIYPLDFLPVIENTALEIQVGEWVIDQALSQLEIWHDQGLKLSVSVNIASYHLQSYGFINNLGTLLEKHAIIPPEYLQLEMLESSALGDVEKISEIIIACRDSLGIQMALDDFGTGYSSLTHLRRLPAQTVKIDQSFIKDMLVDPDDYAIADSVIELSRSFSRLVIAEGVETTEHGLLLLLMGCNLAQGYGIARPMAAGQFPSWLQEYHPNEEWLACAQKQWSSSDKRIEILKLTTKNWFYSILDILCSAQDTRENWTAFCQKESHYIYWINRARQGQFFNSNWLNDLECAFQKLFHAAEDKAKDLQQSQKTMMESEKDILHKVYNEIHTLIDNAL